jgi:putative tryptophan/tyrosine transport system substrate-binding protein
MDRRAFLGAVTLSLLTAPRAAEAQSMGTIHRIGWLSNDRYPPGDEAFQHGLRDLGWVEGRNIITEYRFVQGQPMDPTGALGLAAELVGLKVDLIVAIAGRALFAKDATSTIPIVFVMYADPVGLGLVTSLARPGGNLTGLTSIGTDLVPKRLQLLKDAVPGISRVAVLVNPFRPWTNFETARANAAAQSLGLRLQRVEVPDPTKFERAFSDMVRDHAEALVVDNDALFSYHRRELADLALKHRLPTMSDLREHVEAGGFMAYTVHIPDLYRRAATYVDKILKGAKPAELPVEQPTKFELVINAKTAKALRLTIPPSVLARVDEVIE